MHSERSPTEARQARKTGVVRRVLVLSLGAAVVLLAVVYLWFVSGTSTV